MKEIIYLPVGIIHSPFKKTWVCPYRQQGLRESKERLRFFRNIWKDLRIWKDFPIFFLIYHFHLSHQTSLTVRPFLGQKTSWRIFNQVTGPTESNRFVCCAPIQGRW